MLAMSIEQHARAAAAEMVRLFGADALAEACRRADAANDPAERYAWLVVVAALMEEGGAPA